MLDGAAASPSRTNRADRAAERHVIEGAMTRRPQLPAPAGTPFRAWQTSVSHALMRPLREDGSVTPTQLPGRRSGERPLLERPRLLDVLAGRVERRGTAA